MAKEIIDGQILLGIVAMRNHPKPEVSYLIEDLTKAGIRFALFFERVESVIVIHSV